MRKKNLYLWAFLTISTFCKVQAQNNGLTIVEQTNTIRLLSVRPYFVFGVAPITGDFAADLRVDAQYWHKDKFDVRLGTSGGTFNGVVLGGTYHLRDKSTLTSQKFIISQTETKTTRTTRYYRGTANQRRVFGPAVDAKVGFVQLNSDTKQLYTELDFGIDYQFFTRNYADLKDDSYPSNMNGWYGVKLQGLMALGASKLGVGAVGVMGASRRPWKGVTMHLTLALGAIKYFGGGINPIISPGFGMSINLIKPKA